MRAFLVLAASVGSSGGDADGPKGSTPRSPSQRAKTTSNLPLPENNGLLVDEIYTYLSLLKRYVLYGPTLGFTQPSFSKSGSTSSATLSRMQSMASHGGGEGNRGFNAFGAQTFTMRNRGHSFRGGHGI